MYRADNAAKNILRDFAMKGMGLLAPPEYHHILLTSLEHFLLLPNEVNKMCSFCNEGVLMIYF